MITPRLSSRHEHSQKEKPCPAYPYHSTASKTTPRRRSLPGTDRSGHEGGDSSGDLSQRRFGLGRIDRDAVHSGDRTNSSEASCPCVLSMRLGHSLILPHSPSLPSTPFLFYEKTLQNRSDVPSKGRVVLFIPPQSLCETAHPVCVRIFTLERLDSGISTIEPVSTLFYFCGWRQTQ
jgi:hypothetical protein